MNSAESNKSPNLRDILCLRSRISLMPFISHLLPFFGDSSHSSSPCIEGIDTGPVDNGPSTPDEFLMCRCVSRRKPNMLRPIRDADTARISTVADEKLTSPPVPRKEETRIAETMKVGSVTAPERI